MSDQDEPDSFVQASFVIPCASSAGKGKERAEEDEEGFPVLQPYEADGRAGLLRRRAYDQAVLSARAAFKRVEVQIYTPLIESVVGQITQAGAHSTPYYIPGPTRLTTLALLGTPLSSNLLRQLQDAVEQKEDIHWVQLQPRECLDLATALRLIVARAVRRRAEDAEKFDLSNPATLLTLGSASTVCILFESLATFHYGVFNDIVQAVHSLSKDPSAPKFTLMACAEIGSSILDDKLDPATTPLLDLSRLHICAPTTGFEKVLEEMYLGEQAQTAAWLGSEVVNLLREQYFEQWPSLDQMLATIEIALHHHFTRRPLSVIAALPANPAFFSEEFTSRVREAILQNAAEDVAHSEMRLPAPPSANPPTSMQSHMKRLMQDDGYLFENFEPLAVAIKRRRTSFATCVRLLHLAHTVMGIAGSSTETFDRLHLEPRRTTLGGLVFALLKPQQGRTALQDLRSAIRSRTLAGIEGLLDRIRESGLLQATDHAQQFDALHAKVEDLALTSEEEDYQGDDEESRRLAQVHKRLLREESSTSVKREVADWLAACLHSLLGSPIPLEEEAWTYNHTDYLTALLKPSPRVNVLAALNDPAAYLNRNAAAEAPDVCRVYQTYQDAGRMINMADWYSAFRLSLDSGATRVDSSANGTHKRQRGQSSDSSDLQDDEREIERERKISIQHHKAKATWDRPEMIQARFALAVNELGRMGFLKRTRRKPEHVLKLIHDLPPIKH